MDPTNKATDLVVRESYGRLIAYLAARWGDLMAAEDALSEALLSALKQWPIDGIPDRPEAWLLTIAKRRLVDMARRGAIHETALTTFQTAIQLAEAQALNSASFFPDERLKLLFICAHPAIHPTIRTPLLLQSVLGLNAIQIGSAFLIAPTAMGQRLVRAKQKIRDARISFDIPEQHELAPRFGAVLEAIYAAYQTGWDEVAGAGAKADGLTEEAIWLARTLLDLMPEEPEAQGLLALLLHCEARRNARQVNGRYIPLYEQDTSLWTMALFDEAEWRLSQAAKANRLGRFQLEAAIQSAHSNSLLTKTPEWITIAQLYEGLVNQFPTIGAFVGRAAARSNAFGVEAGLAALQEIPEKEVAHYQPYWALKAYLLTQTGEMDLANHAYMLAIGLTENAIVRCFLQQQATHTVGPKELQR